MPKSGDESSRTAMSPVLFLLGTLELGGSEKKTVDLAVRLARRGFPAHVAYLRKPDPLRDRLGDVPTIHLAQTGKFSIRALRNLAAYIEANNIKVVVTINLYPLLYAIPAVRLLARTGCRVVATVNTSEFLSARDRLAMLLYAPLLRRSTEIVFGSENQQRDWVDHYRLDSSRCRVIYNGVDGARFDPDACMSESRDCRKDIGVPPDAPVIVCVGKLRPEKGHLNLLEAMKLLKTESSMETYLLVVGDGAERQRIEAAASRLGLGRNVKMIGNVDDVRPYLALSDVFALPSVAVETFSNAALEAAAMGLPVVISDVGGATEMFDQQPSARIYPRHDCPALAGALFELLSGKLADKHVRSETRAGILSRFSLAKMDANWITTIRGACAGA